jgi:hypothetical protein
VEQRDSSHDHGRRRPSRRGSRPSTSLSTRAAATEDFSHDRERWPPSRRGNRDNNAEAVHRHHHGRGAKAGHKHSSHKKHATNKDKDKNKDRNKE